ncbi:hypothetical protein [Paenibacillus hamazuiensis]|uniref:hypothetical protein n=1 Tax=Paenibacillus hamazuiensis TaxID=2936508 RepID=UPI00200E233A|nr:hypothetical protein [Paenibacillus hamazuiensis]
MREFLLICEACDEYTSLGSYDDRERRFEGEYSLLYNEKTNNDEVLVRFLRIHAGHPLCAVVSGSEAYAKAIASARHFMADDLDKMVEESLWRQGEKEQQLTMDRELGRLQLSVLRKLLEEETAEIAGRTAASAAESQFLLGKEEGLKRALDIVSELLEKTSVYYR